MSTVGKLQRCYGRRVLLLQRASVSHTPLIADACAPFVRQEEELEESVTMIDRAEVLHFLQA